MQKPNRKRELEDLAKSGDVEALTHLFVLYREKLIGLAMRYLHNPHSAEDAVADSYEKAWKKFDNFRGEADVYTWLYRIVVNTAQNTLKKNKRHVFVSLSDTFSGETWFEERYRPNLTSLVYTDSVHTLLSDATPENQLADADIKEAFLLSVENMPPKQKRVFMLREVDDLTYEEISQVVGCPLGTVRSRLYHAREALAKDLGGYQRAK